MADQIKSSVDKRLHSSGPSSQSNPMSDLHWDLSRFHSPSLHSAASVHATLSFLMAPKKTLPTKVMHPFELWRSALAVICQEPDGHDVSRGNYT